MLVKVPKREMKLGPPVQFRGGGLKLVLPSIQLAFLRFPFATNQTLGFTSLRTRFLLGQVRPIVASETNALVCRTFILNDPKKGNETRKPEIQFLLLVRRAGNEKWKQTIQLVVSFEGTKAWEFLPSFPTFPNSKVGNVGMNRKGFPNKGNHRMDALFRGPCISGSKQIRARFRQVQSSGPKRDCVSFLAVSGPSSAGTFMGKVFRCLSAFSLVFSTKRNSSHRPSPAPKISGPSSAGSG